MAYRVFQAQWWADAKCTRPINLGRRHKRTIRFVETVEEARALCAAHNLDDTGARIQRPYGSALEFEEC